ncbi:Carboxy-terminal domain RNA polymerase II polypeptide A small phosphatase [Trichinella spiralis]|uniref:Mitochondrial import inner membrane translocase subunit TIM50 n=1 Tax=Trichinella spiralis TaxID=6334 RepID=A0ABR3KZM2_TRISP
MDESNASKLQQKKPEEEAGTSTEKKGKLNRLKKMWDGLIQHLCPRRTRNGVNSDSSSNDIPKLTVVFDLDSTLIYSTREKLFSNQEKIDSIRYFVAIRPHCREVLQAVREVANMMVYSAGTPKYVRHIVRFSIQKESFSITTGAKAALFRRAKDSNKQNRKQIIGRVAHAPILISHRINCGDHADA